MHSGAQAPCGRAVRAPVCAGQAHALASHTQHTKRTHTHTQHTKPQTQTQTQTQHAHTTQMHSTHTKHKHSINIPCPPPLNHLDRATLRVHSTTVHTRVLLTTDNFTIKDSLKQVHGCITINGGKIGTLENNPERANSEKQKRQGGHTHHTPHVSLPIHSPGGLASMWACACVTTSSAPLQAVMPAKKTRVLPFTQPNSHSSTANPGYYPYAVNPRRRPVHYWLGSSINNASHAYNLVAAAYRWTTMHLAWLLQ